MGVIRKVCDKKPDVYMKLSLIFSKPSEIDDEGLKLRIQSSLEQLYGTTHGTEFEVSRTTPAKLTESASAVLKVSQIHRPRVLTALAMTTLYVDARLTVIPEAESPSLLDIV